MMLVASKECYRAQDMSDAENDADDQGKKLKYKQFQLLKDGLGHGSTIKDNMIQM